MKPPRAAAQAVSSVFCFRRKEKHLGFLLAERNPFMI
jgi:hypothetical protein